MLGKILSGMLVEPRRVKWDLPCGCVFSVLARGKCVHCFVCVGSALVGNYILYANACGCIAGRVT